MSARRHESAHIIGNQHWSLADETERELYIGERFIIVIDLNRVVGNNDVIVKAGGAELNIARADELFHLADLLVGERAGLHFISALDRLVVLFGPTGANCRVAFKFGFSSNHANDINVFVSVEHITEAESEEKRVVDDIKQFLH